jgi:hypothetical protein
MQVSMDTACALLETSGPRTYNQAVHSALCDSLCADGGAGSVAPPAGTGYYCALSMRDLACPDGGSDAASSVDGGLAPIEPAFQIALTCYVPATYESDAGCGQ